MIEEIVTAAAMFEEIVRQRQGDGKESGDEPREAQGS
jgi:hypothetical protein